MRDKRIDALYPPIREAVEEFLAEAKQRLGAVIFQGYRSLPDQKTLYAQGRTTPGKIVTDAKAGWSYHNYGLALDVVFLDGENQPSWSPTYDWKTLGVLGKKHGFEWGGSWPDPYIHDMPHFQMTFDHSVQELYRVYAKTWLLQDVWAFISNGGSDGAHPNH